jgi:hypothetical protein
MRSIVPAVLAAIADVCLADGVALEDVVARRGAGGRGGGGGRRSDIHLKHDITLLGYLASGLGYYRFSFNGSDKPYVGVIAQEVQSVRPDAVVNYDMLGLRRMTWDQWVASGKGFPPRQLAIDRWKQPLRTREGLKNGQIY